MTLSEQLRVGPDRTSRFRALALPGGLAVAAVAAAAVVATVDPNEPGHFPPCPVLALTGFYCTGCGTLRAAHALLHLDLAGAWAMNPATLLFAPVVVATWLAWMVRAWTGRPRRWAAPTWSVVAGLVALVAFTVARNTATFAWLAPG